MGAITNIDQEGFASAAFHAFPDMLSFDPLSGDYGPNFFGHALNAATYVVNHPEFGWQAFGGNVIRAPQIMHGKTSRIHHDDKTIFKDLPQDFVATRYHSLIVERSSLPDCLEISAYSPNGLIMGLRHKETKVEGVQFHPESVLTEAGKQLLANFLRL